MNQDFPKNEEKILKFWKEKKIFKKSLEKTKKGSRFVFYEGPPFANGTLTACRLKWKQRKS